MVITWVKMRINSSVNESTYLNYIANSINRDELVIFSFDIQHEGSIRISSNILWVAINCRFWF